MATKKKTATATEAVAIPPMNLKNVSFEVTGTSPLVMNKFSHKALMQMMDQQKGGQAAKNKKTREPKDFDALYEQAIHYGKNGGKETWYGIPAPAFRNAMISACRLAGYTMTRAKLAFHIEADGFDTQDGTPLVRIIEGEPAQHIQPVVLESGVRDIRIRPMWQSWKALVNIRYDGDQFRTADVANLLMRAGAQVGILEGRPDSKKSCGQGWGLFSVLDCK